MGETNLTVWLSYQIWLMNYIHFRYEGYQKLVHLLWNTPFEGKLIGFDENWIANGLFLREYFERQTGKNLGIFKDHSCTVMEVLIAISMRIEEYIGYESASETLWELLENLGLDKFRDKKSKLSSEKDGKNDIFYTFESGFDKKSALVILQTWMERRYKSNGKGGLFPLKSTKRDQKQVEMWSQLNEYYHEKLD